MCRRNLSPHVFIQHKSQILNLINTHFVKSGIRNSTDMQLFKLWAKTDRGLTRDEPHAQELPGFHPLIFHLMDVAACAKALLAYEKERLSWLAEAGKVDADILSQCFVTLIALHDIGKCARGFQGKVLDLWPAFYGDKPKQELSVRHDAAGLYLLTKDEALHTLIEDLLPDLESENRRRLLQSVCGHHGQPIEIQFPSHYPDIKNPKADIGTVATDAASEIAQALKTLFDPKPCSIDESAVPLLSYWLAGLTILADWLGSNPLWFPFLPPPQEGEFQSIIRHYWENRACPGAEHALRESGLIPAQVSHLASLHDLFDIAFLPTPLQNHVQSMDLGEGPLLVLIEDMTGAGKTEAAILLAQRFIQAGKARGLHIALPTMATANAMFNRLARTYRRMFAGDHDPSIVLTHGRRDLFWQFTFLTISDTHSKAIARDNEDPSAIEAGVFCADWIARSNKQAFLAQIGAGTVDQALLGVLPVRHQSLRLFGLADKVLIIDEAHAYDAYMGEEISRLITFHAALGGSAIILSATLTKEKRETLASSFRSGLSGEKCSVKFEQSAYPLVTTVSRENEREEPLALRPELARTVKVIRIDTLDATHEHALAAARRGAAVAVIRNTVDEAIASFESLKQAFSGDVLLFHARFAMADRQEREREVLERFGKGEKRGRNAILIATQVIEQSLDLDFDLVISDLAPVDLLIQRAGRLWRHERGPRPIEGPVVAVLSPEPRADDGKDWPKPLLPQTGYVYKNIGILWRSAKVLFNAGKIVSRTSTALAEPESGEIRALIEATYGEHIPLPPDIEPTALNADGEDYADRSKARFQLLELCSGYDWQGTKWEKESKKRTRLGEETLILRLAQLEAGQAVPYARTEDEDEHGAWALSEVQVRCTRCTGAANGPEEEALIEKTKAKWSLSEKEMPVVILHPEDGGRWSGKILDGKKKPSGMTYSKETGLQFAT